MKNQTSISWQSALLVLFQELRRRKEKKKERSQASFYRSRNEMVCDELFFVAAILSTL